MAKTEMTDLPQLLAEAQTLVDQDDPAKGRSHDLMKRFRRHRKGTKPNRSYSSALQALVPAPLILEGMVKVTLEQMGTAAAAIVHAEWTDRSGQRVDAAAGEFCEEQWLIFPAEAGALTMNFNGTGGTYTYTTARAAYRDRLPWTSKEYPSGPATTFWYPISFGGNVNAQQFFAGLKVLKDAGVSFGYVHATLTKSALTDQAPVTPDEAKQGGKGRGWEEHITRSDFTLEANRGWAYAEWQTTGTNPRSVKVHMAWKDVAELPPLKSAMTAARTTNRLELKDWLPDIRRRLGINSTDHGYYAVGTANLYDALPGSKP